MTTEWIDQGEVAAESQADPAMAVGEPRNPFLVALGERVRTLRSRQGMTRKAVARAASGRPGPCSRQVCVPATVRFC